MRIDSVEIKNFKSIKHKRLSFDKQFSLIIGDNGTGKTSILEALSIGLGGYLAGIEGVNTRNIFPDELRKESFKYGDATITWETQIPCVVSCIGEINNKHVEWERSIETIKGKTRRLKALNLIDIAEDMQKEIVKSNNQKIILPLLSYQSAGRLFSQKKDKWTNPFEQKEMSRFVGYTDCLDVESNIKLFVHWLRKMTLITLQKQKKIGELDATLSAIQEFMKELTDIDEEITINYDFEADEVMVSTEDKVFPLRLMSSGYRSLIGMVAELAFRMSILNPHLLENAVKLTPGVVLIDELDLHLHPKWQWRIVESLKKTFPNIQFIATTHAPIVISSCNEGRIINISEDESEHSNDTDETPYGWLIEDVLTNVMNTHSRMPSIQKKIDDLEKLYSKKISSQLNEAESKELTHLKNQLYNVLPEDDPAVALAKLDAIKNKVTKKNQS